jgi:hypothetical protein
MVGQREAAGMTGLLGRRGAELALFVDLKRKAHVGGAQRQQGSRDSLNKKVISLVDEIGSKVTRDRI